MRARIGIIGLAIILLGISSSSCRRGSDCQRTRSADMFSQLQPELREMIEKDPFAGGIDDVTTCQVGPFTVIAPASGNQDAMFIFKGKDLIYSRSQGSSTMWRNQTSTVDLVEAKEPGKPPSLAYTVHDGSGGMVMVIDRDFDGQADSRLRSHTGRPNWERRREKWLNDHWVDIIDHDGKAGYMRDGQFVPLASEDSGAP